jgi:hypothetical protein
MHKLRLGGKEIYLDLRKFNISANPNLISTKNFLPGNFSWKRLDSSPASPEDVGWVNNLDCTRKDFLEYANKLSQIYQRSFKEALEVSCRANLPVFDMLVCLRCEYRLEGSRFRSQESKSLCIKGIPASYIIPYSLYDSQNFLKPYKEKIEANFKDKSILEINFQN